MIGAASSESVARPHISRDWVRVWQDPSFWAQDDFKVNEKLTMNLGLRWDIYPLHRGGAQHLHFLQPERARTRLPATWGRLQFAGNGNPALYCNCRTPSPIYWKNIGPRLGLAYSVNPKTVIRGQLQRELRARRLDGGGGGQSDSPGTLGLTPSGSTPTAQATSGFPLIYWDGTACARRHEHRRQLRLQRDRWRRPHRPTGGTSLAEYGTGNNSTTTSSGSGIELIRSVQGAIVRLSSSTGHLASSARSRATCRSRSATWAARDTSSRAAWIRIKPAAMRCPPGSLALAGVSAGRDSGTITRCTGLTCTTPLLATKWSAANRALFQSLGFTPPNPYTGGVTYTTSQQHDRATLRVTRNTAWAIPPTSPATPTTMRLQISLRQRPAHGVDFMLNYTYSKSMDDVGTFRTDG